jgi:hypothetical protein
MGVRTIMMDRELEALIQDTLDGTATPEQIKHLEAKLAASETAQSRRREMESVFTHLKGVPSEAAPADLRYSVLRELSRGQRSKRRSLASLSSRFAPLALARVAIPFAFGIAVGVIGFSLVTNPGRVPGNVAGTMMPAGSRVIQVGAGAGRVRITGEHPGATQILHIVAASEVDAIELEFDPAVTRATAVRNDDPSHGTVEMSDRGIVLRPEGNGAFTIELLQSGHGAPLSVALRGPDGIVSRTIPAGFGSGS